MMLKTFEEGKDFYAMIASISFHRDYEDCLEFYPEGTPIKKVDGKWVKCPIEESEKLAGHKTDTNTEGKKFRTNSKSILLGILYGRGDASVAEQLGCSVEEAKEIKQAVYEGFPAIEKFERDGLEHAKKYGWVSTLWGRKRRLPDINLPEYEVFEAIHTEDGEYVRGEKVDDIYATPVINKVRKAFFNQRRTLIEELKKKGYYVVNNGGKIAQARRQVTNSQIQGTAADMSKKALIKLNGDDRLNALHAKPIIPIHDEVILSSPFRYAREVEKRFAYDMETAATDKLHLDISTDVEVTFNWYGESLDLDKELKDFEEEIDDTLVK